MNEKVIYKVGPQPRRCSMSFRKMIMRACFVITVSTSLVFLAYSADVYFDTYALRHELRISIQIFDVMVQNSQASVETVLLLENPSRFDLKITRIHEEIYRDPNYRFLLGDRYLRPDTPGKEYVVVVPPFSNNTVTIMVSIEDFPSEDSIAKWFIILNMRIGDVPLVGALYLTRHLTWPS